MYDELYHWGILGMKWGVRHYQNKDGTLTEAGKVRYGKIANKMSSEELTKRISDDVKNRKYYERIYWDLRDSGMDDKSAMIKTMEHMTDDAELIKTGLTVTTMIAGILLPVTSIQRAALQANKPIKDFIVDKMTDTVGSLLSASSDSAINGALSFAMDNFTKNPELAIAITNKLKR